MLTLKTLITFAAVAVFSASAAPAPGPSPTPGERTTDAISVAEAAIQARDSDIQARASYASIKFCKNHYFNDCLTVGIHDGQCLGDLSNVWNDVISSYEVVNRSEFVCRFHEHGNCQGAYTDVQHDNTLHDDGGWWADRISSIRCWRQVPNGGGGGCGAPFC